MKGPYDDIIHLPHHVSDKRPQMPMQERAAQFSPFAALDGYHFAIRETARLTDRPPELTEEAMAGLNRKLQIIADRLDEHPLLTFTCFQPDEKKTGGAYITLSGTVQKIDAYERRILLQNGTVLLLDNLVDIEGEIFSLLQP